MIAENITAERIYRAWTGDSIWAPWVKPVLFAHLKPAVIDHALSEVVEAGPSGIAGMAQAGGGTAIVVDLPGATSAAAGLALAERGYRPAPLYNAAPLFLPGSFMPARPLTTADPIGVPGFEPVVPLDLRFGASEKQPRVAIDMYPIVQWLVQGAQLPVLKKLATEAPPAFLLDSRRRGPGAPCQPGDFDNRSVSLPTDFPSANFMLANGIRDVIVIQQREGMRNRILRTRFDAGRKPALRSELQRPRGGRNP
ncbi:MAG TPA: hypothetical protein VFY29_04955 [Terriglobia bacterium]|nr:hypothetical protein [Terriglobia bacterium]